MRSFILSVALGLATVMAAAGSADVAVGKNNVTELVILSHRMETDRLCRPPWRKGHVQSFGKRVDCEAHNRIVGCIATHISAVLV